MSVTFNWVEDNRPQELQVTKGLLQFTDLDTLLRNTTTYDPFIAPATGRLIGISLDVVGFQGLHVWTDGPVERSDREFWGYYFDGGPYPTFNAGGGNGFPRIALHTDDIYLDTGIQRPCDEDYLASHGHCPDRTIEYLNFGHWQRDWTVPEPSMISFVLVALVIVYRLRRFL